MGRFVPVNLVRVPSENIHLGLIGIPPEAGFGLCQPFVTVGTEPLFFVRVHMAEAAEVIINLFPGGRRVFPCTVGIGDLREDAAVIEDVELDVQVDRVPRLAVRTGRRLGPFFPLYIKCILVIW